MAFSQISAERAVERGGVLFAEQRVSLLLATVGSRHQLDERVERDVDVWALLGGLLLEVGVEASDYCIVCDHQYGVALPLQLEDDRFQTLREEIALVQWLTDTNRS